MGIVADPAGDSRLPVAVLLLAPLHLVKQGLINDGLVQAVEVFVLVPNLAHVELVLPDVVAVLASRQGRIEQGAMQTAEKTGSRPDVLAA